jgi:zinc protease
MKRTFLRTALGTFTLVILVAVAAVTTVPPAAAQATTWQQVPIPPLPAFKPQQPKRIQLSNGMVIFLQEDHELPLIDGTARIRGGSINEPADKTGLIDIYGEVWRTGGTKTQTGDQLDDFLEVRAAKVETGGSSDSTTISFSCLKGDLDDVFKAFIDVLRNPAFNADKIDIAQKEENDGISRRNDQVGDIAQRESVKLAYGADNPYARVSEYATIAAITRQDLVDWHAKYVHPNNIILGISGDFNSAAMEAKLRSIFESWPKGEAAPKNDFKYTPAKPGYYLVSKDDVNQSTIHMVGAEPRATIPTTTLSACSTKLLAADSPRACLTTSAPSGAWPTAWAAALAPTSDIPASCRSRLARRARAPSKRYRPPVKTSTIWASNRSPTTKSSTPKTRS